jgi:hypothetical protein
MPTAHGTPHPQHQGPRLLGAVATARSERIVVFRAGVDRGGHETARPLLVPGHNVVIAVGGRGLEPVLVELGPTNALRLAAALFAATGDRQNGG